MDIYVYCNRKQNYSANFLQTSMNLDGECLCYITTGSVKRQQYIHTARACSYNSHSAPYFIQSNRTIRFRFSQHRLISYSTQSPQSIPKKFPANSNYRTIRFYFTQTGNRTQRFRTFRRYWLSRNWASQTCNRQLSTPYSQQRASLQKLLRSRVHNLLCCWDAHVM